MGRIISIFEKKTDIVLNPKHAGSTRIDDSNKLSSDNTYWNYRDDHCHSHYALSPGLGNLLSHQYVFHRDP